MSHIGRPTTGMPLISITTDTLIPFSAVADYCPSSRKGKRLHTSTPARWAKYGCIADDGTTVKLETIRVGATLRTSVEALQRFFDRLSAVPGAAPVRSESWEQRQERARNELVALGLYPMRSITSAANERSRSA